jgi:hypothetical protein
VGKVEGRGRGGRLDRRREFEHTAVSERPAAQRCLVVKRPDGSEMVGHHIIVIIILGWRVVEGNKALAWVIAQVEGVTKCRSEKDRKREEEWACRKATEGAGNTCFTVVGLRDVEESKALASGTPQEIRSGDKTHLQH